MDRNLSRIKLIDWQQYLCLQEDAIQRCPALTVLKEGNNNNNDTCVGLIKTSLHERFMKTVIEFLLLLVCIVYLETILCPTAVCQLY